MEPSIKENPILRQEGAQFLIPQLHLEDNAVAGAARVKRIAYVDNEARVRRDRKLLYHGRGVLWLEHVLDRAHLRGLVSPDPIMRHELYMDDTKTSLYF